MKSINKEMVAQLKETRFAIDPDTHTGRLCPTQWCPSEDIIDLTNGSHSVLLYGTEWNDSLRIAEEHGWESEGTLPPENLDYIPESFRSLFSTTPTYSHADGKKPMKDRRGWDKSYREACYQTIGECDSVELATAIRRACYCDCGLVDKEHPEMMRRLAAFLFEGPVSILPTIDSNDLPDARDSIFNPKTHK
jgi:hypothetical protein